MPFSLTYNPVYKKAFLNFKASPSDSFRPQPLLASCLKIVLPRDWDGLYGLVLESSLQTQLFVWLPPLTWKRRRRKVSRGRRDTHWHLMQTNINHDFFVNWITTVQYPHMEPLDISRSLFENCLVQPNSAKENFASTQNNFIYNHQVFLFVGGSWFGLRCVRVQLVASKTLRDIIQHHGRNSP